MNEVYMCLKCHSENSSLDQPCSSCGSDQISTHNAWGVKLASDTALNIAAESKDQRLIDAVTQLHRAMEHIILEFTQIEKERVREKEQRT